LLVSSDVAASLGVNYDVVMHMAPEHCTDLHIYLFDMGGQLDITEPKFQFNISSVAVYTTLLMTKPFGHFCTTYHTAPVDKGACDANYTTPDSTVSYLNHAEIAQTTPCCLLYYARLQPKVT